MSKMADSSKMCGHMTNFFYGSLETVGGTTSLLAQITPLSPTLFEQQDCHGRDGGRFG